MKKILFLLIVFFMSVSHVNAQRLYVDGVVSVPEKGEANIVLKYESGGKDITGYGFTINLPKGLSFVFENGSIKMTYVDGKGFLATYQNGNFGFLPQSPGNKVSGGTGELLILTIEADETLKAGESFDIDITDASFTDEQLAEVSVPNSTFTVKIIENITILDENDTEAPKAAENVNVRVLRSINADSWSTICLPFAMAEEQVVSAFGDDVQIAEFTGCDWDDAAQDISLSFTSKTQKSIEANHPYLIKVTQAISHDTGFRADGVTISPSKEPTVEVSGGDAAFIGTYEFLEGIGSSRSPVLFIAQNKFWYSKGTANLKPYRGYFDIDSLKDFIANAKIGFIVNDESTSIDGMHGQQIVEGVYDLSGRKIQLESNDLNKLQKGVYVIDGKKVTIK